MSGELTEAVVAALRDGAREAGLPRFGVTALEDETLRRSQGVLQDFLRRGFHGEMQFLEVTATMRGQPSTLLEGARAALVVAVPYGGEGAPIARYAQWADYHTIVHRRLERVVQQLEALVPGAQTKICVDTKPVPERTLAMRAGLKLLGGTSLFRLFAARNAEALFTRLAEQRILIRTLPYSDTWVRFGLPGAEEGWRRLGEAL